jgi:hypothetical protein
MVVKAIGASVEKAAVRGVFPDDEGAHRVRAPRHALKEGVAERVAGFAEFELGSVLLVRSDLVDGAGCLRGGRAVGENNHPDSEYWIGVPRKPESWGATFVDECQHRDTVRDAVLLRVVY